MTTGDSAQKRVTSVLEATCGVLVSAQRRALWGEKTALVCGICQFPWCKSSHCG